MKSVIASIITTILVMFASGAFATDMPPEAKEFHCDTCHAIDHKVIGPAWLDVANKYKGQKTYKYSSYGSATPDAREYPLVEGLVMKVSKGGSGNWGSQPMIANNVLGSKKDKIKALVEFILGLAK